MMTEERAVVEVEACTKTFDTGAGVVTAVDDVSLELGRGELVALVGPSGSGKTTLLSLVGALLTQTAGTVRFEGTDLTELDDRQRTALRATRVGLVFQTAALVPFLTAAENVALVGGFAGMAPAAARSRAEQLLTELELGARKNHRPGQLSGGEQQRVAIARAMLNEPRLLLADEPTAHLDRQRGLQVIDLVVATVHAHQCAGMVVTHDERIASKADRILHIEDGRLVS